MLRNLNFLGIIAILLILSACGLTNRPSKRYKSIYPQKNDDSIDHYIDVDAYFLENKAPKSSPKSIFDLSDNAQAQLIREIGKKDTSIEKMLTRIKTGIPFSFDKSSNIIDKTTFEKRIVISISNNSHSPADRISKIEVSVDLGPEITMLSCNRLATEFQLLDLGKISSNSALSGELSGQVGSGASSETTVTDGNKTSLSSANLNAVATGKINATKSYSEEILLRQRFVALNASIDTNSVSLYQESISGIDLTGNIIADIVFESKSAVVKSVFDFSPLYKKDKKSLSKEINIRERYFVYPDVTKDLKGTISFHASYRKVNKGDATISESDDRVELFYGDVENSFRPILISKNRLVPQLFNLSFKDDPSHSPVRIINDTKNINTEILFMSYIQARNFLSWLKTSFPKGDKSFDLGKNENKYTIILPNSSKYDLLDLVVGVSL